jgi:hypothetical protein
MVTVDRKRVGRVAPVDRLEIRCIPGIHSVRVRQWHLRSRPIEVDAPAGLLVNIEVDDPSLRPFLRSWLSSMIAPGRALTMSQSTPVVEAIAPGDPQGPSSAAALRDRNEQDRRRVLLSGLLSALGFALLLIAIAAGVPILFLPAIASIAVGIWFAIRLFSRASRSKH